MAAKRRTHKNFVLDTNVLMHDPNALYRFEDNDLYIPFAVLEELDKHKTGTQDINRNARQAIRLLGGLLADGGLDKGYSLKALSGGQATGRLFFQAEVVEISAAMVKKADNEILSYVEYLQKRLAPRQVTLVSKDINLRVKAKARGLPADDYLSDHAVEDADLLYTGVTYLDHSPLDVPGVEAMHADGRILYRLPETALAGTRLNEFLVTPDGLALQMTQAEGGKFLRTMLPYSGRNAVWGVQALNVEQSMALNMLMDPDLDIVSLLGPAGTGKTLLTLAAALQQTLEDNRFAEIIFTRATVPLGDDIGFLPGGEEEKMHPWLGALEDCLDVLLCNQEGVEDWKKKTTRELVMKRIRVKSIAFMRGRTFHRKFVIFDEAQNLTPKQIKSLITRAGPGSKVVLLGNLSQIDSPYLSESGSGLAYAVERFKNWQHYGHIILSQGERSRLASFANDNL